MHHMRKIKFSLFRIYGNLMNRQMFKYEVNNGIKRLGLLCCCKGYLSPHPQITFKLYKWAGVRS